MSLRSKLSNRSALIFGCTLGFVLLGTYLLFQQYTRDEYYKKLVGRANTAAFFFLEKDELTSQKYREIEEKYRRITNESVRLYHAHTFQPFVGDSLDFKVPETVLHTIVKDGSHNFRINGRQLAGIFYKDNQGDFIIVASGINMAGNGQLMVLRWMLVAFFMIGLALNYFMTGWLAHQTFRPFSRVIRKVNSITADNLHTRLELPAGSRDELGQLVETFNYFLARLEDGVEGQRSFLKNASHELKTPLAVIIGDVEVALKHPRETKEYISLLESLKHNALHLKSIVESLLVLSGLEMQKQQQLQSVRVDEVLWNVLEKKEIEHPGAKVTVRFAEMAQYESLLSMNGNRELLFIAFSNLMDNAIKYSSPHTVAVTIGALNNRLNIVIADKGPGLSASEKDKIFELFYRSNHTRHIPGHGIGLYLTRQIFDLHHISVHIEDNIPHGTVMHVGFPSVQ